MLVLKHVNQLAMMSEKALERKVLFSEIQPVTFGYDINWAAGATYVLGSYFVPKNSWLVVLRTECYTVNYTAGSGQLNIYGPPPPGTAYWIRANDTSNAGTKVTPSSAETHLLLDVDQFLSFQGGRYANLIGVLDASSDSETRSVRTKCYGYLVGAPIIDALLGQVNVISTV
jgi:hypothetical protein